MAEAFQSDAFQNDAFQSGQTQSGSFTASAVIRRAQSAGFTADAVLRRGRSGVLTTDAVLRRGRSGSFTIDAYLHKPGTGQLTADAILRKTQIFGGGLATPDGSWVANTLGSAIYGLAYGNGYWVAVGNNGALYYKADTPNGSWTSNPQGSTILWAVLYANGYWIAVGNSGVIYYTTDPTGSWTLNTQGSSNFISLAYSGGTDGYWIAGCVTNGHLYYASDPTGSWTLKDTAATRIDALAYGNGYWVAVGDNGAGACEVSYLACASNAAPSGTWTVHTQGPSLGGNALAYGNGYWVLGGVGIADNLYYTTDPTQFPWANSQNLGNYTLYRVAYLHGYWIVGSTTGRIFWRLGDPTSAFSNSSLSASTAYAFAAGNDYLAVAMGAGIYYKPPPASGIFFDAIVRRIYTPTLTFDAVIAGVAATGSFFADAVLRRSQTGSLTVDAIIHGTGSTTFTADAWITIGVTVESSFTADAVILRSWSSSFAVDAAIRGQMQATMTAGAVIRKAWTGTITADAEIVNRKFGSFATDAILRRTQSGSFRARAVIRVPGETGVHIRVNGADITEDVLFSEAQFTTLVNGAPGTFRLRIRDSDQTRQFIAGDEITLDINGIRRFGGYISTPSKGYFFDVDDTSTPSLVERVLTITGWDYNILFAKRVVRNKTNPEKVLLRSWPAGSYDDTVIKYIFDQYTDLADDNITYDRVEHVGSPMPDVPGVVGSGGLYFGDLMNEVNRLIGAVWYISPDKDLTFTDVDTPNATIALSDRPVAGEVGYRELQHTENGVRLINDAMVWGAGTGSSKMVRARVVDYDSIAAHGRWQYGEFTTQLYKQASVQKRAETIVYGTPQNKRGGKDDQVSWQLATFDDSFVVGQKVAIESEVWGVSDVVPIRRMTISWPTSERDKPRFDLALSHEIDEPWNSFEFWFPRFKGQGKIDVPIIEDGIPPSDGSLMIDDFDRVETGRLGCSSSHYPWNPMLDQNPRLSVSGGRLVWEGGGVDQQWMYLPYDPRNCSLAYDLDILAVKEGYSFPGGSIEHKIYIDGWEGSTHLGQVEFQIWAFEPSTDNPVGQPTLQLVAGPGAGQDQDVVYGIHSAASRVSITISGTSAQCSFAGLFVAMTVAWQTPTDPSAVTTQITIREEGGSLTAADHIWINNLTGNFAVATSVELDRCSDGD